MVPKRTSKWISVGDEREEGKDWSAEPLIPKKVLLRLKSLAS